MSYAQTTQRAPRSFRLGAVPAAGAPRGMFAYLLFALSFGFTGAVVLGLIH